MSDGLSAETRRSSFELSPPLVALAAFHAAAIRHGVVPDLAPEVAFLCDALAAPIDVVAGSTRRVRNKKHSVVVARARRRVAAALALSRSGRAPHAAGERALALCASAAASPRAGAARLAGARARRGAPAPLRRGGSDVGSARRRRAALGRRSASGLPGSSLSARRISSPRRSRARGHGRDRRRGPAPPRGGGGRRRVRRRGEHRRRTGTGKCRDALYARLRALAADGGGAGSMPRTISGRKGRIC